MVWSACVVRSAGNRPAAARAGGAPHRSRDIRVRLRRLDFDRVLDVPRAVEAKLEHGAAAAVPGTRATVFCSFVVVKHRNCPPLSKFSLRFNAAAARRARDDTRPRKRSSRSSLLLGTRPSCDPPPAPFNKNHRRCALRRTTRARALTIARSVVAFERAIASGRARRQSPIVLLRSAVK